ncbi:MAG: TetR/AcrR family transcriptional regulator [Steroidobacteraceae bacterium]
MKSKKSRRLSSAERRARILEGAVQAFARAGYAGTSMNRIAAAAGVTKPVLYDHYASKQELYVAVLEGVRDDLLARGKIISERRSGPEGRFQAAVGEFFRAVADRPEAIRVLLHAPQADAAAASLWRRVQEGATTGIAALLSTVWRPGEDWECAAAAEFIKAGLHALAEWSTRHPGCDHNELVSVVMQIVWRGVGHPRRP